MIVYAYYGSGKTTLCKSAKDSIFYEIEEEFGQTEELQHIKNMSKDHIVFVNGHIGLLENDDVHIDMAFLPSDVNIAVNRLHERGVDDAFLTYMLETFDDVKKAVESKTDNIIYYDTDKYLSDYVDYMTSNRFTERIRAGLQRNCT